MKKHCLLALLLLLSVSLVSAQTWIQRYYYGELCPGPFDSSDAELCNVIPAIGGGYLLQGYVEFAWGDIHAYEDNVFWKLDEYGDIVWRRTGRASSAFNSIVSNGVDRYYCLNDHYLYVYDSEMNSIAYYIFPTVNGFSASLYDMQYVDDGLVFAGRIGNQAVVIKTDFQFNVIWQSDPFWAHGFHFRAIEPYENDWVAVTQRSFSQFDAVGDSIWTVIDSVNLTSFFDVAVSYNGTIYSLTRDVIGYKVVRVCLTTQSFEVVANINPLSGNSPNQSISCLPNGNIVYTGRTSTNQLLHSYSPDGVHQWSRSYDTLGAIYFGTGSKNLLVMPDGSILFPMHHGTVAYLVKTDAEGNVVSNDDPIAPVAVASIMAYPQPASSTVMISVKSDLVGDLGYSVFNIRGQRVYSGKINGHHKEQSFELPNEALDRMTSGVYLISLERGRQQITTTKLVVVK
jgi:hypothetical protein